MSSRFDSVLFSAAEPFKSRCLIGSYRAEARGREVEIKKWIVTRINKNS